MRILVNLLVDLVDQIEFTDVIIVNKTDFVSTTKLESFEAVLRSLNASAKLIRSVLGKVSLNELLNTKRCDFDKATAAPGWMAVFRGEDRPEAANMASRASSTVYASHSTRSDCTGSCSSKSSYRAYFGPWFLLDCHSAKTDRAVVASGARDGTLPAGHMVGQRTPGSLDEPPRRAGRYPYELRRRVWGQSAGTGLHRPEVRRTGDPCSPRNGSDDRRCVDRWAGCLVEDPRSAP